MLYLKNKVISTDFGYVRYIKVIEEISGFGKENSLILSS